MKTRIVKKNESGKKLNGLLVLALAVSFAVSPVPVWAGNDNRSTNPAGAIATKPVVKQGTTRTQAPVLRGQAPVAVVRSHIPQGSPAVVTAPDFLTWNGDAASHLRFLQNIFRSVPRPPSACSHSRAKACTVTYKTNAVETVTVSYAWPAGTSNARRFRPENVKQIVYAHNPANNTFFYDQGELIACGDDPDDTSCSEDNAVDMTPAFHRPFSFATDPAVRKLLLVAFPPFYNNAGSHRAYLSTHYGQTTSKPKSMPGHRITRYTDKATGDLVATYDYWKEKDVPKQTITYETTSQFFEYAATEVDSLYDHANLPFQRFSFSLTNYDGPKTQLNCAFGSNWSTCLAGEYHSVPFPKVSV